jgi:pimeloyl-ACP methyl ester carboxylesterase
MVVFLHGMAGYRIGPHGLLREIAESLAEIGIYSCRFDFRGRGYSSGNNMETNILSMYEDVEIVLQNLQKIYGILELNLLGICSGAKLAILYALKTSMKIDNIIGLSTETLFENKKKPKLSMNSIQDYSKKIFSTATWSKLVRGEINFRRILKNILFIPKLGNRKRSNVQQSKLIHPFINFAGETLLIYGDKDPIYNESLKQITNLLDKYKKKYSKIIIEGGDHNFYSVQHKEKIISDLKYWFLKRYSDQI